jgi:hypothetical protein
MTQMKVKGPILTLLAGAMLAAVLFVLSTRAAVTERTAADTATGSTAVVATPSTGATPSAGPSAGTQPAPPAATRPATYAGSVVGGGASIAISVRGQQAVAYLCDGRRTEAWLSGAAQGGRLSLTSRAGGKLTGAYDAGWATGTLTAGGRQWTFRVKLVKPPSGLYRGTAQVRNARVVGTWIVVDGVQVGVALVGEQPTAAPALDQATNTAVVDGVTITAEPVDPATAQ